MSTRFTDFTEHVRGVFAEHGDTRSYTFLHDLGREVKEERMTFGELDHRARELGEWAAREIGTGNRALLLYPQGLEFVQAFFGCLYSGVVAVPAPLPTDRSSMRRMAGMIRDARISAVFTTAHLRAEIEDMFSGLGPGLDDIPCVATDIERSGDAELWRPPGLQADSVAFLQYTSGSTSDPKGVVITHANLVANEENIFGVAGMDSGSLMLGWLPHFHDMGLVGMLLNPAYTGADCVFMAPLSFIKRPLRWLEAATRFRATNILGPNFAYDLCVRKISDDQIATLDLSCLRSAISGAEPIRATTLEAFARRFAPAGFRPEMFEPCFGMAEATLLVSGARLGEPPVIREIDPVALEEHRIREVSPGSGTRFVSCGEPINLDVEIVDPKTCEALPEKRAGEVWIRGTSVAAGYWNTPERTAETFGARTADGEEDFLRTGDLGFLWDGELFITGRLKDIVIVRGRNLYPQDIEQVAQEVHPALASRTGAAFSVESKADTHLVIVQEVRKGLLRGTTAEEVATGVRQKLVEEFDVSFPSVVLVGSGVPRTTSGKVQRRLAHSMFLEERFKPLAEVVAPAVRALRSANAPG